MLLRIINIIAFFMMVIMNYLANALPLNGKTTGQLSAQYPNLFVPAGITFSIWGAIYLMLLGFCLLQFRSAYKPQTEAIGWLFAASCLLNALWIVAWHYEQLPLSMLVMLALLGTLVIINQNITTAPVGYYKAAFGIYLGWICIATIANATALLVDYNWGGWGLSHVNWAIVMIAAGTAITLFAMTRVDNPYMALAVIWALTGIILKRQADHQAIVIAALIGIMLLAMLAFWLFLKKT